MQWARGADVLVDLPGGQVRQASSLAPVCADPGLPGAEYVACPGQTGVLTTAKNWPTVLLGGTHPTFGALSIVLSPPKGTPSRLVGQATVGSAKLTFTGTSPKQVGNVWRYRDVKADAVLPQRVMDLTGSHMLSIDWMVKVFGRMRPAGTTRLDVFVLRVKPAHGAGQPFLSLIYPAARDANGAGNPKATVRGVWRSFASDALYGYGLDATTGAIQKDGRHLQFWPTGWSPQAQFSGSYPAPACATTVLGLLATSLATCDGFADYMATMLKLLGVDAQVTEPNLVPNPAAPRSGGFIPFLGAQYFLVGRWSFTSPSPPGAVYFDARFPYAVGFHYPASGSPTLGPDSVAFRGATGQHNPTPVAMWSTLKGGVPFLSPGDHRIVDTGVGPKPLYDPSYRTGPFDNIQAWMRASIVGWARVVDENGRIVPNIADCGSAPGTAFPTCYILFHNGLQ
jgi:hypothetical protein